MGAPRKNGYARVLTAQPIGIGAELVTVEADLSHGLHTFSIVGLADKAVAEARDRISSAIKNTGFKPPKATNRRIILSLSPASMRKDGSQYDLPLAIAYLIAAGHVSAPKDRALFCGELGLDGSVRPVRNVLAHTLCALKEGVGNIFVPTANAQEATLVNGICVRPVSHLQDIIAHLTEVSPIEPAAPTLNKQAARDFDIDFAEVMGQESAKRALLIAAAGRHNVMLYGPPGSGKTMLARALRSILPPLSKAEVLSVTAIHAAAGELRPGQIIFEPPFRAPHHTVSTSAMIGGGPSMRPGEVTLAHGGVLFMDEFVEFDSRSLEALRQPLEDQVVHIARAKGAVSFPANFMLIGAMNPAETLADDDTAIRRRTLRQAERLSRPIIDRIDIWVEVPRVPLSAWARKGKSGDSKEIRRQVAAARERLLTGERACAKEAETVLRAAGERLTLSVRRQERVLRIARTIAALAGAPSVETKHVMEALQYRPHARGFAS